MLCPAKCCAFNSQHADRQSRIVPNALVIKDRLFATCVTMAFLLIMAQVVKVNVEIVINSDVVRPPQHKQDQ